MKKRSILYEILLYLVIFAVIVISVSFLRSGSTQTEKIDYADVVTYFENKQVSEVTVTPKNQLILKVTVDGKTSQVTYKMPNINLFYNDLEETVIEQINEGVITAYDIQPAAETPWWVSLLPWLLIIVAFVVIWIVFFNQMGGRNGKMNSFGRARVRTPEQDDKKKVLFSDVAGADEEKAELVEIVDFLRDPQKYTRLGARIPHGVLLVGPPGTGKTLLAKAVAGEAGVPFYSISGSDFVEMYVGVGASRVRDLFETARKTPAAIVFIDEIDAVGRHRGAGLGGGHDEREQTLNQLLVEMDGFGSHDGIIVMAATNRPDILDPALLRPGRFDRQITVNYPDMKGREEILKVHTKNKPLENGVDFHKIAQSTVGFTGADLANLMNEAALLAAKRNKALIGMEEVEDSYMKSLLGPQKKNRFRTEEDKRITAYHEAGHAVVSHFCEKTDPVKFITIIPAGNANGVTVSVPELDRNHLSRGEMLDEVRMTLGGRIAEELVIKDITTGASQDIQQATKRVRAMVTRFGMSDKLGTVLYGSEHTSDEIFLGRDYGSGQNYSERTAAIIDEEVQRIIGECYADAKKILSDHLDRLTFVAEYLVTHETMDGDQFAAAMKEDATVEELEAIAEEKAKKSREDNDKALTDRKKAEEEAKAQEEAAAQEPLPDEKTGLDFFAGSQTEETNETTDPSDGGAENNEHEKDDSSSDDSNGFKF